ncbi:hypothetical protein SeLEV6574_g01731 [Synchytrium endobioticum]|uniref:Uncharacterized protein n=1 Tax=Synchytrium endobioticum TaxID=286115 RepID=A0A507DBF8_9FUNG|nr:hypothetical protein SeLEV6574_g01731 [Synchytrium endobioticum]
MDESPIRIATALPNKKFGGEVTEYDVWRREIINKAAVNGLTAVIKGIKPANWTELKWLEANNQYLGFIRLSLTHEVESQIAETQELVKPVLDYIDGTYNKVSKAKKSVLLKELLNIRQGSVAIGMGDFSSNKSRHACLPGGTLEHDERPTYLKPPVAIDHLDLFGSVVE